MSKSVVSHFSKIRSLLGGDLQGSQERATSSSDYTCAPHEGSMEWKEKEARGGHKSTEMPRKGGY